MTRRILLVLLAFTAAVLVAAVVPLTLDAANHDRASFIQATAGMVTTDAAISQALLDAMYQKLDQGKADGAPLVTLITQTQLAGDGLLIFKNNVKQQQSLQVSKGMPPGDWTGLAARARDQGQADRKAGRTIKPVTVAVGSRVDAAMPVYLRGSPNSPQVGTVILARSTRSLNGDIVGLWLTYGTIAAVAMLGAALLAFGLARWVSRPVTGLDSAAARLADGDLASRAVVDSGPPELRRLAGTFNTMAGALEELARLSRLVDGLLTVARAENVVPVPTAVDVSEVASERFVAWHPVADDRGITLEVPSPEQPAVLAWLGEGHLEQVLDNLIANALEALEAGGHVTVTTTATTAGAQIVVADDGPGMSAEDRERAFLRFTTSNPNGTGLGLAIVHRLVTSNGGTARLSETPGGGLTTTLTFPGVPGANGSSTLPMNAVVQEHSPPTSNQDFISL